MEDRREKVEYLLPPEIWKKMTGEKKLTGAFLDWFYRERERFVARAERYFPGLSGRRPSDWSDGERLCFSMYLQTVAKKRAALARTYGIENPNDKKGEKT